MAKELAQALKDTPAWRGNLPHARPLKPVMSKGTERPDMTAHPFPLALALVLLALSAPAATPVMEARGRLQDAAAGTLEVAGTVTTRLLLPDRRALVFLQEGEGLGLPVLLPAGTAGTARDALKVTGKPLKEGSLGFPVLAAESATVTATNRGISGVEPRTAAALKDAAPFEGRYFVLTNATFDTSEPAFRAGTLARLTDATGPLWILVSAALDGRPKPAHPVNLFGVAVPHAGHGWVMIPARFVPADSPAMRQLATKHTCITCHQPDQRLVGPSYREVAARYLEDPEAITKLIAQMNNGGSGKWGAVPMLPFKGRVPPDEMRLLAEWIMEMRWDHLLAL